MRATFPALLLPFLLTACFGSEEREIIGTVQPPPDEPALAAPAPVQALELGEVMNLSVCGEIWLAGQPTAADFEHIASAGVKRMVSLCQPAEMEAIGDAERAAEAGLAWSNQPYRKAEELTDELIDAVRAELNSEGAGPVMLYCASANRVGAVWIAHRVLDQGVDLETARAEAREIGLRTDEYETVMLDYVSRHADG